ncbi:MAG: type II toxin-antitoxin system RelE/ParE family toxin [Magnetococcus sp. MYC-9]
MPVSGGAYCTLHPFLPTIPDRQGPKKLEGTADTWRIRTGDYRIIYTIEDDRLVVLVVKIGHRREVYW